MKTKFKKTLLMVLITFLLATPVFADEYSIDSLADEMIRIEVVKDDQENYVTKYSGLILFSENVKQKFPMLSQLDLAKYLMEYTQQDYTGFSDEEILEILQYDSFSTVKYYIRIDESGNICMINDNVAPLWTTNDGYIEFDTSFANTGTNSEGQNCWDVWTRAMWQKYPVTRSNDVLTLGHNAIFDDSVTVTAHINQTFKCLNCGENTYRYRSVSSANSLSSGDLKIKHHSLAPAAHFNIAEKECDNCTNPIALSDTRLSAYLKYGLITNGSANIIPGYGHTKLGVGLPTVSFSSNGTPTFSSTISSIENYIAPAVTVK